MDAYEKFKANFSVGDLPIYTTAKTVIRTAATSYFAGLSVRIMTSVSKSTERRTKLQNALSDLSKYGATEDNLDAVLKTQLDKSMRV